MAHDTNPDDLPITPTAGQVFDIAVARARRERAPEIPDEVLEDMASAARLFEALAAQGHELRFHEDGVGAVRAELRTVEGAVVRRVPLREAVDVGGGPAPAA